MRVETSGQVLKLDRSRGPPIGISLVLQSNVKEGEGLFIVRLFTFLSICHFLLSTVLACLPDGGGGLTAATTPLIKYRAISTTVEIAKPLPIGLYPSKATTTRPGLHDSFVWCDADSPSSSAGCVPFESRANHWLVDFKSFGLINR